MTIPTIPAGLYLRDTWQQRLGHLGLAVICLCFTAALLGLTILGIAQSIAAVTHDYITWGLAAYLLLAALCGVGTVVFGRSFAQEAWGAVRPLPAEYPELPTGAVHTG